MWPFKKSANKGIPKRVSVYISYKEQQIIIAPMHRNYAGIYYEQESCTILKYPPDYSLFGEEIVNNFNHCTLKDKNLRGHKRSDWPAYKASKLKSIKLFEKNYLRISVFGANEGNITLVIEGISLLDSDLTMGSAIALYCDNRKSLGKLVMKVYLACFGIFNDAKPELKSGNV